MIMRRETSNIMTRLVTAGTTPAATMDAFYDLLFPEVLWDPADTSSCKVVVTCLYATKATKTLITWLHRGKIILK
jgi:hypothetical protein